MMHLYLCIVDLYIYLFIDKSKDSVNLNCETYCEHTRYQVLTVKNIEMTIFLDCCHIVLLVPYQGIRLTSNPSL
jgi:hypothetical protein